MTSMVTMGDGRTLAHLITAKARDTRQKFEEMTGQTLNFIENFKFADSQSSPRTGLLKHKGLKP